MNNITREQMDGLLKLREIVIFESMNKHLVDLREKHLSPDYHLSMTITVKEARDLIALVDSIAKAF